MTRWRRVVFPSPSSVSFQRMNDMFATFPAKTDETARTVTLTNPANKAWTARFVYERPSADRLILDGEMDAFTVRLTTHALDANAFPLVSRGFHWVQEYPFNR